MKGVLLRHAPEAQIVDVTHAVGAQDVLGGSIVLERAVRVFGAGTVHVAVVDPGVGSERKLLVVRVKGQTVICPDNGLITWTWRRHGGGKAYELTQRPGRASDTFHGRDIMAPLAGRIAAGEGLRKFCGAVTAPRLLDIAPAESLEEACVIHIDHFGNATTNVPAELIVDRSKRVQVGRNRIAIKRAYADVEVGAAVALIGSSGLLEIAVRNGSAATQLHLSVGDRITFV